MFRIEAYQEIAASMRMNKLRTLLTAFAVGWGVLILVILLSAGQGLKNGIKKQTDANGMSNSTITLYGNLLSKPYKGYGKGMPVKLYYWDIPLIMDHVPEVKAIAPVIYNYAYNATYGDQKTPLLLNGMDEAYNKVSKIPLMTNDSRVINASDNHECKKVIVLNDLAAQKLFGSANEAIGKVIQIKQNESTTSFPFKVVGISKANNGIYSDSYIPIKTMMALHLNLDRSPLRVTELVLDCPGIYSDKQVKALHKKLTLLLASTHKFSPDDEEAIYLSAVYAEKEKLRNFFTGLDAFLWMIGISTLVIGIVGVVNIMHVGVAERSKEFGIRKALGAKPADIIGMVVKEAIFITLIAGLMGLVIGVGLMALVSLLMEHWGWGTISFNEEKAQILIDPIISLATAIGTLIVMVVSGVIAGYLPARKAVKVQAIESMRN